MKTLVGPTLYPYAEDFKLHMCHQNCLRFYDEIAYDPSFNGLVLDDSEGERLVKVMDGKRVLLHQNHGVIVCGESVAEAFDDIYYLERACQVRGTSICHSQLYL